MGARHALFRPFVALRTVEIPESPRGWYGADRPPQQGRSRSAQVRSAVISAVGEAHFIEAAQQNLPRGQAPSVTRATHWLRLPRSSTARGAGDGRDRGARKTRIHRRDGQTSHASRRDRGSSGECVGWRTRIGRERGVGDLPGRRTRRARMSSGPGGIARQLIDLPVEDQRYQSAKQTEGQDQAGPRPDRRSFTLACPRRLPHHL